MFLFNLKYSSAFLIRSLSIGTNLGSALLLILTSSIDGIIDNIDLDIDNDGISNFYESLGDGKISFQDPLNPEITLLSGTVIPGVISGSVVSTRDDHAISNGTVESSFESQVEAGVDQTLIYTLDFSEKLNILVTDSNIDVAQIDGESFVLKSLPLSLIHI